MAYLSDRKFVEDLIQRNPRALAKVITLIESGLQKDHEILCTILSKIPKQNKYSKIIGITGPPGVGKSTFINALAKKLIEKKNTKIAILTIDPSSQKGGGSLLGDKTRMVDLVQYENVFIRPSPGKADLGGVSQQTFEIALLMELVGFDYIFIETIGAGQSNFTIRFVADIVLGLEQPGSGDDIQVLKKGLNEYLDILVISKNDGLLKEEVLRKKHILSQNTSLPIFTVSSLDFLGFDEIIQEIDVVQSHKISDIRIKNQFFWLRKRFENTLSTWANDNEIFENINTKHGLNELLSINNYISAKNLYKLALQEKLTFQ